MEVPEGETVVHIDMDIWPTVARLLNNSQPTEQEHKDATTAFVHGLTTATTAEQRRKLHDEYRKIVGDRKANTPIRLEVKH